MRKRGNFEGARRVVMSGVGRREMDRVRAIITRMERNEGDLLEQRSNEARGATRAASLTFLVVAVLAVASMGLLFGLVRRYVEERERATAEREALLAAEQAARAAAESARGEAEEANRAKDRFLATLSHELRSPLSAILSWAHVSRKAGLDEPSAARALDAIEGNTRLQARLIEDLLDVSRIVLGKLSLNMAPVELRSVVQAAVDGVLPETQARGLRMTFGPADETFVQGDGARLHQVVGNLLSNAIKFTPRGGRISVALHRGASHAEICVRDTGKGIPRDFLPHVFERFRQDESAATGRHGGLGIGLAIVRNLVELPSPSPHTRR